MKTHVLLSNATGLLAWSCYSKRVIILGAFVGMTWLGAGQVKAQSSYVIDLYQDGSDVVATGSGTIDLDGLTYSETDAEDPYIDPRSGTIIAGTSANSDLYSGISGPTDFGSGGGAGGGFHGGHGGFHVGGGFHGADGGVSGTGDIVGVEGDGGFHGGGELYVPAGYISGTLLSDSATFSDTTLADLGVTPGTYVWTWGTDGEDSFTLDAVAVPEPSQYGWGVLLATLGFVGWRRFYGRFPLLRP